MSKKPEERYQTAVELCKEIKHCKRLLADHRKGRKHLSLKGNAPTSYNVTNTERLRRQQREQQDTKTKWLLLVMILSSVFLALAVILIMTFSGKKEQKELVQKENGQSKQILEEQSTKKSTIIKEMPGLQFYKFSIKEENLAKATDVKMVYSGVFNNYEKIDMGDSSFGYVLEGIIDIPESDKYTFKLTADDYYHFEIDGFKILSHADGLPQREKNIQLSKGKKKFRAVFFQGIGRVNLECKIQSSTLPLQPIPLNWFFYTKQQGASPPIIKATELKEIYSLIEEGKDYLAKLVEEKKKEAKVSQPLKKENVAVVKKEESSSKAPPKKISPLVFQSSFNDLDVKTEGKGLKSTLYSPLIVRTDQKVEGVAGILKKKVVKTFKDQIMLVDEGVNNQAIEFTGSSEPRGIRYESTGDFDSKSFSVGLWYKQEFSKDYQMIVSKTGKSAQDAGWWISTRGDYIIIRAKDSNGNILSQIVKNDQSFGRWQHLVMVFDSEEGEIQGYLNGKKDGWVNKNSVGAVKAFKKGSKVSAPKSDLLIGNLKLKNRPFVGVLDELSVWSKALTEKEVLEKYSKYSEKVTKLEDVGEVLLAYGESFSYPVGKVISHVGKGGYGWQSKWLYNGEILKGALEAPKGVLLARSEGEHLSLKKTGCERYLDCSAKGPFAKAWLRNKYRKIGVTGKSVYISFIYETSATRQRHEFILLRNKARVASFGNNVLSKKEFNLSVGQQKSNPITAGNNKVNFVVLRIDYKSGDDEVSVYMNPPSLDEEPTASAWKSPLKGDLTFDGIGISAAGIPSLKIDEIRIGNSYKSVTAR